MKTITKSTFQLFVYQLDHADKENISITDALRKENTNGARIPPHKNSIMQICYYHCHDVFVILYMSFVIHTTIACRSFFGY